MYAGAAREAVFSVPAVIRRIKADFVPLALRAPLVNGADRVQDEDEKWLYQRVNRAKLAPQGICVLDSSGQVLVWVQMFDSNKGVLDFLDHALKRFRDNAGGKPPAVTEQYMKFPSNKVREFQDHTKLAAVAEGHAKGKTCPAKNAKGEVPPGALVAQLVGRALDDKGKPLADVVNQEHYAEDQFIIAPEMQETVAQALANAGTDRVQFPPAFSKLCATYAHLGHIDVRPLFGAGPNQNKGEWKKCKFWAEKVEVGKESTLWRVEGESEVVSKLAINGQGVHHVKLAWEGFLTMKGARMRRLLLSARGTEKLDFCKDDHPLRKVKQDEVAFLPGGRPIDVEGGVRYGIIGEPLAADEAEEKAPAKRGGLAKAARVAQEIPDEARKQLVEVLGGPFLVFRDKVQEELKLSDKQKEKLSQQLAEHIQETMKVFEKIKDAKPQERDKTMQEHRQKSHEKLSTALKDVLEGRQQERLLQLQLQREGAFALLGRHEAFAKLKITDEQRKQFMEVVQQMQKKIEPLLKEIEKGAKPEEIRPKAMKIRKEHADKIEALLTEAQKKQWKRLLGKPFDLGD